MTTLDEVNLRISHFPYCYTDSKNKPVLLSPTNLDSSDHSLRQTGMLCYFLLFSLFFLLILASQLWCLGRLLPLLIGDLVPDDDPYWDNYLLLLTIVDYVFAPTLSKRTPAFLTVLINDHLSQFKEIYTNCSIIPKQHYLIHIPQWIEQ